MSYEVDDKVELDGRPVTILAVDRSFPSVIQTAGGEFKSIRFKVRERSGRVHWTCRFADPDRPVWKDPADARS